MKKKSYFLTVIMVLPVFMYQTIHAQFLKKLKDKVNNEVDKTVGGNNTKSTTTATSGSNNSNAKINFASYNVITQPMYNAGDIKEKMHEFEPGFCLYEIQDSEIVARSVVYAGDGETEAGGFTGHTAAYIFKNNKLVQQTTISAIEDQKDALHEAYRKWDYPFSADKNTLNIQYNLNYNPSAPFAKATIIFRGKTYGPYFSVNGSVTNKDSSKFYAIISTAYTDKNSDAVITYYLISSDGKKVTLPSLSTGIITNVNFSNAATYGFTSKLEAETNKGVDATKAAINTLTSGDMYFIDGTIIKNANTTSAVYLDPSGKNFIGADRYAGSYINGKNIVDKGGDRGNVWCNANATKWCYYGSDGDKTGHLVFSDGTDIPSATHPAQIPLNGKTYIVWMYYSEATGDILCKKEL
jgi:hypothetical protein